MSKISEEENIYNLLDKVGKELKKAINENNSLKGEIGLLEKINEKICEEIEEGKIQAKIEIIQAYYNKIILENLSVQDVLYLLEADKIFLQQEKN